MIVRVGRRVGAASFASFIHTMISMCSAAELLGHQAYVDWRDQPANYYRDDRGGNQWEWFLHQPMQDAAPHDSPLWIYEEAGWRPDAVGWELPWNAETPEAIAELRRIVLKFLKFKQEIIARGDALFAWHGLDPQKTVAVSHRGTDKGVEATVAPIESYYPHLDEAVAMGLRLWVKAEEAATIRTLEKRYPGCVVMSQFFYAPSKGVLSDALPGRSGYDKARDVVLMIYMMSRCRIMLKNAGNLSDLAAGLSCGEVVCVR